MDSKTLMYVGLAGLAYWIYTRSQAAAPAAAVPLTRLQAAVAPYPTLTVDQFNATAAKYPNATPEQVAAVAAGFGPLPA